MKRLQICKRRLYTPGDTHVHTRLLESSTMGLMVAALFLMGAGYGLHCSVLGLFVCMATCSRSTLGAFCLLFAAPVLGYVFSEYGYAGWGGDVIVAIGLVLLHSRYPLQKAIAECKDGFFLLMSCTLVLLFFYFYGPHNSHALWLMIDFVKLGFLSFVAFFFIFRDRSVDWQRLGLLGIFSGLIYLAYAGKIDQGILPGSVLDIAGVNLVKARESHLYTHFLSFLPALGFMFIYSKDVTKAKTRKDITILIISLFTTVILVGWSGSRQGIVFLLIGMFSIVIVGPQVRKRQYIIPIAAVVLLCAAIVLIGILQDFHSYTDLFDGDKTLYQKLNRDVNFHAALWLFKQKPFLGQGLGGFYIPGDPSAGDQAYAHNFVLDLLSQIGLIGTVAFFSPFLLFRVFRKRIRMLTGLVNGNAVLPVFCVPFLYPMISGAFSGSGRFIALIGVIPMLQTKSGYTTHQELRQALPKVEDVSGKKRGYFVKGESCKTSYR